MVDEEDKERLDRELIELLNELRVALPGVQVLFAFLLILPFQQRFADTSAEDKGVFTLALLLCALAAALLIAPSMYHRLNFRRGNKERLLFDSNRLMVAGMICLAIGVACSVYLVVDVLYGGVAAVIATAGTLIVFAALWLGLPLAQAFYNKEEGVSRIATETGAGQWGSAMAFAGALFGLEVKVYMVRASYDQKPYRRILMETYGAEVVASPSLTTNYGRSVLSEDPDSPGSLGIAISEAVEDAATRDDTKYALGSVLNHVLLHQTVIGQEAIEQMGMAGESPDIVIGCTGGGSNFAGLTFPFLGRNLREGANHRIIAVEPEAAPSLTRGVYAYDFGDTAKMAPVAKMHTLGHDFIPEPIHAGGLRYHGMSPLVSLLKDHGDIEARSVHQRSSFEAGVAFARAEGILPAPEPTHAIRVAMDEAIAAREAGEAKVILFNLCGHGHFDLGAYERFLDGSLEDYEYPREKVEAALAGLPSVG